MAVIITNGEILENGRLNIDQDHFDLPPGRVRITIETETYSSSLDEIKAWMQNPPELTPEGQAKLDAFYDHHEQIARETGLPDDFADRLDDYLYHNRDED